MRVQPRWWIGLVVFAVYGLAVFNVGLLEGLQRGMYWKEEMVFQGIIKPMAIAGGLLVVLVTLLGWWRPVMFDESRGRPLWALLIVLALWLAVIAENVTGARWSTTAGSHLALLVLAAFLIAFCEEVATRGVLVAAFRGSTSSEVWPWLVSSLLFGLLHLPNEPFGLGLGVGLEVALVFGLGTALYILRRVSGTLLLPLAVHWAWLLTDYASRVGPQTGSSSMAHTVLNAAAYLVPIVLVAFVIRQSAADRGGTA